MLSRTRGSKRHLAAAALALGILACRNDRPELEPSVEARIEARLHEEGFTFVMAAADKGIVTLTGFVPTEDERVRAREVANGFTEVTVVEDRMLVRIRRW